MVQVLLGLRDWDADEVVHEYFEAVCQPLVEDPRGSSAGLILPLFCFCPLRLFTSPIPSAAPLPLIVLEAPWPACPRDCNLVPRGLFHAAALIKVRWRR